MASDMEKRIIEETGGKPAEEIKKLNLDNCDTAQITGLTDDFKNLVSLSVVNSGLTSLKGFPSLPNLRKLDLTDNKLSGGLNVLQGSPHLVSLNLSGNKIKDIETLEPLKDLKELKNLDLLNCEVSLTDDFRGRVFQLLEGLAVLDGFDRNNQEAEEDETSEEGEDGDGVVDFDEDDGEGEDEEGDDDDEDSEGDGEDVDEEDDQEAGQGKSRGVKRKHADEEEDH